MRSTDKKLFQPREFAELTGVTVRTLHHYDRVGLLRPAGRSEAGYRLYTEDDVQKIVLLRELTESGHAIGDVASLDDGTFAGSVLTMDRAFSTLVRMMGVGLVEAAAVCATTPARALGLKDTGIIAKGAIADLAVLDADLRVTHTFISGRIVEPRGTFTRN